MATRQRLGGSAANGGLPQVELTIILYGGALAGWLRDGGALENLGCWWRGDGGDGGVRSMGWGGVGERLAGHIDLHNSIATLLRYYMAPTTIEYAGLQ